MPQGGGQVALFSIVMMLVCTGHAARLPADIHQWEYFKTSSTHHENPLEASGCKYTKFGRFWDRELLRHGIGTANLGLLSRLVTKLDAGLPLLVVAMGSSVTADFGGEFAARPDAVASAVPRPVFREHLRGRDGFLRMFMHMVNTTWPHPDHLLYNAGVAATNFLETSTLQCLEASMPNRTVDLFIGEFLPDSNDYFNDMRVQTSGLQMEQLIWRVSSFYAAMHAPRPYFVFLRNIVLDWNDTRHSSCAAHCHNNCAAESCQQLLGPLSQRDRNVPLYSEWQCEERIHSIVRYLGFASLSTMYLFLAADRDPALTANTSYCEMASKLYSDRVHPSHYGQVLYADLLVNLLADAADTLYNSQHPVDTGGALLPPAPPMQAAASAQHSSDTHAVLAAAGAAVSVGMAAALQSPLSPLFVGGHTPSLTRCYGETDGLNNVQFLHSIYDPGMLAVWTNATQALDSNFVVAAHGWHFTRIAQHHSPQHGAPKYKPGWLAHTVGATLRFRVNTAFPDPKAHSSGAVGAANVTVQIMHLVSYMHMGIVRVSCVEACRCTAEEINAHRAAHESISVAHDVRSVSQAEACVMEVVVLANSTSPDGEHKFKIIQVVVMFQGAI